MLNSFKIKWVIVFLMLGILASIKALITQFTHHPVNINNFIIFVNSFHHLVAQQNLYANYGPTEHIDLFKYSPMFAMFMGLFAYFPKNIGAVIWNICNSLLLYFALVRFTLSFDFNRPENINHNNHFFKYKIQYLLIFMLNASFSSLESYQTNILIGSLALLFMVNLKNDKLFKAAFFIVAAVFVKLYIVFLFVLLIFYHKKIGRVLMYSGIWTILFIALPFVIGSFSYNLHLYQHWFDLVRLDTNVSYGMSVMGFLNKVTGLNIITKQIISVGGVVITLFTIFIAFLSRDNLLNNTADKTNDFAIQPSLTTSKYTQLLCNVVALSLITIIIFNPKAESQTFVVAYLGVAIWFFNQTRYNFYIIITFILVILFGVLAPTDIYSHSIRNNLFVPYSAQAVVCFLSWVTISYQIIVNYLRSSRG